MSCRCLRISCLELDRLQDAFAALVAEAIHLPPSAAADAVNAGLESVGEVLRDIGREADKVDSA